MVFSEGEWLVLDGDVDLLEHRVRVAKKGHGGLAQLELVLGDVDLQQGGFDLLLLKSSPGSNLLRPSNVLCRLEIENPPAIEGSGTLDT